MVSFLQGKVIKDHRVMRTFISFEEARAIVLSSATTTRTESVAFENAIGRTLREDVLSTEPIPGFDNSAMDGYAVRFEDCVSGPVTLKVVSDIPAGINPGVLVGPGQAARIMTGAPLPAGADSIVPIEKTNSKDRTEVHIGEAPRSGAHVRYAGEELKAGDTVMRSGIVLTPPAIGMLASVGKILVDVACKPRLAIISTGDEVIPADERPVLGQLRNSNGPSLAAQAVSAGADVTVTKHLPDDPAAIRSFVQSIKNVDLLVFSGGVSMGEYDYVRTELDAMGAVWEFWKVKQRPGKPLAFGTLDGIPVLGLPGNPVSSSVCFEMYARPMIAAMSGRDNPLRITIQATLRRDIPKVERLYTFARGNLSTDPETGLTMVDTTGNQASGMFTSMVDADCIIHLPDGLKSAEAGSKVTVELLSWSLS